MMTGLEKVRAYKADRDASRGYYDRAHRLVVLVRDGLAYDIAVDLVASELYQAALDDRERQQRPQRPEDDKLYACVTFISKLVNMQSGKGWSRAVVRTAAMKFLREYGFSPYATGDSTPEMLAVSERAVLTTEEPSDG